MTLLKSDSSNATGFTGVRFMGFTGFISGSTRRPYEARVRREGRNVGLGYFATAEQAALCNARTLEGRAAASAVAAAPAPMTEEEAFRQAEAEGLTLLKADSVSGFKGVYFDSSAKNRPYKAQVWRDGKSVSLRTFVTAVEAALCIARTPEGWAAAAAAAAAPPAPQLSSTADGGGGGAAGGVGGADAADSGRPSRSYFPATTGPTSPPRRGGALPKASIQYMC